MTKAEVTQAVKRLIDRAAMEQGWSIAELTRRLHKGASTLHRWRNGQTVSFDMPILLQLCDYSGMTLDEVFGLGAAAADAPRPAAALAAEARADKLEVEMRKVQGLVQAAISMLSSVDQTLVQSANEPGASVAENAVAKTRNRLQQLHAKRAGEAATKVKARKQG